MANMDFNQIFFKFCVFYPVVFLRRERVAYFLKQLDRSQWASKAELQALQEAKLGKLIQCMRAEGRFHNNNGLRHFPSGSSVSLNDLNSLPFVTKSDLQNFQGAAARPLKGPLTKKTTSGSTGQPVIVWKTPDAMAQEQAANWRGFSWAGIRIGDRQGRFWGVPSNEKDRMRAKLVDFVTNRRRYSAFSFARNDMNEYTSRLNRFRPRYLYGYVSMLTAYAEFLLSTGKKLDFSLRAVIGTSEVLTPYHRQLFQQAFGATVYNEYGCGELGTIAHECERGSLHVNAENMIVEILQGDTPCRPGELGEVVVTELNNLATPLIRYRLGDFASFALAQCDCGRGLPVLGQIVGRAYDMIYNREGKMFHGEFFMYIFEEIKRKGLGIGAFQVVQEDYETFTIRIRPEKSYGAETERLVAERIRQGYSADAKINFVKVDEVEREKSGKMRLVVGLRSNSKAAGPLPETTRSATLRSE
jgi:phenylacetate-CoA ligase